MTTDPRDYSLLALVFSNMYVYVFETSSQRLRNVYRSHFRGESPITAPYLHSDPRPAFYLLDTIKDTHRTQAKLACIAWSHALHSYGYQIIDSDVLKGPLHPNDKVRLNQISGYDLASRLHPSKNISKDFEFGAPHTYSVSFPISPEQHQKLINAARDLGMSFRDYCQAQFEQHTIQRPTLSELRDCTLAAEAVQRTCISLQNSSLLSIHGLQHPNAEGLQAFSLLTDSINELSRALDNLNTRIQQLYYGDD